ncbi:hypothetical protein QQS21_006060 [Conoideocrella luteorostrata]|uniref:CCD97-like C-terminal domain-containing protein n=1 Tax=Conoideocrella luteorostrata TaxID=1105319 RepID=A0AAJ0CPC6_9HYPO|nr:hypothetical protein QQS21_006060 [Conoideocrella luteorostrata]
MIENCTTLYPNDQVGLRVSEYSDQHSLRLPERLLQYHDWVLQSQPCAYFTISLLEARTLSWLARLTNAQRVLEIGAFVGFSVATWSHAVGKDGLVTGLEKSPEYARLAQNQLQRFECYNTEILVGDGLETLSQLRPKVPYDIIFIDAEKSGYPEYLRTILERSQPGQDNRLLRAGGLIIGDNALRAGLVADATDSNPATKTVPTQTINWNWGSIAFLDEFNKLMNTHPRLEAVVLPVFDGLYPILYERLIKRHQTSQERQEEGVTKGYARILEADLARGETRLSALATEAAGEQRTEFTATAKWKPRLDIDHAWNEEATSKEQGRELWKGYLTERFVQGGDEDFEYSAVDGDEELDGEERQAEVDKWFDDEEEGWDNGEKTGETGIQDF